MEYDELEQEGLLLANLRANAKYTPNGQERIVALRLAAKGLAKIVGNGVELTEKGEDVAEGVTGAILDSYRELIE